MLTIARLTMIAVMLGAGCAADQDVFVPEPDDEVIDPSDPPLDPDPDDTELGIPTDADLAGYPEEPTEAQAIEIKAKCPKRTRTLSPSGLTFILHISKHADEADAAYRQLKDVRHLIRARDIFMIERKSSVVFALRKLFPCNEFHFIAYPEDGELANAFAAKAILDGVAVDWERGLWNNPQSWTVDKLSGYANKIHAHGLSAGVVPYWPSSFNDGHIVRASNMNYDIAQIQDHCVVSASSFGYGARALIQNFVAHGLQPRDIGFEISMNSYAHAGKHTGVDRSVACTRKAYGKGGRAIYLYGNGWPHYSKYFRAIAKLGLRTKK